MTVSVTFEPSPLFQLDSNTTLMTMNAGNKKLTPAKIAQYCGADHGVTSLLLHGLTGPAESNTSDKGFYQHLDIPLQSQSTNMACDACLWVSMGVL